MLKFIFYLYFFISTLSYVFTDSTGWKSGKKGGLGKEEKERKRLTNTLGFDIMMKSSKDSRGNHVEQPRSKISKSKNKSKN